MGSKLERHEVTVCFAKGKESLFLLTNSSYLSFVCKHWVCFKNVDSSQEPCKIKQGTQKPNFGLSWKGSIKCPVACGNFLG